MKRPEEHTNRLWLRDGLYAQLKQLSAETGLSVAKLAEGFLGEAIDGEGRWSPRLQAALRWRMTTLPRVLGRARG